MVDGGFLGDRSDSKNMAQISHSIDSLNTRADSVGRAMFNDMKRTTYRENTLTKNDSTKIEKGERICQFRIMEKQPELDFIVVEQLGNEDRGGIGSTGVK